MAGAPRVQFQNSTVMQPQRNLILFLALGSIEGNNI